MAFAFADPREMIVCYVAPSIHLSSANVSNSCNGSVRVTLDWRREDGEDSQHRIRLRRALKKQVRMFGMRGHVSQSTSQACSLPTIGFGDWLQCPDQLRRVVSGG
jgi:hypothetical protein